MELIRFTHDQRDILRARDIATNGLLCSESGNRIYQVTRDLLVTVCCIAAVVAYNRFIILPAQPFLRDLPALPPHIFKTAMFLIAAFQGILFAIVLTELAVPKHIRAAHKTYKKWRKQVVLLSDIQKMYGLYEKLTEVNGKIGLSDDKRTILYISRPSEKNTLSVIHQYPLSQEEALLLQTESGKISFASYDRMLEDILKRSSANQE